MLRGDMNEFKRTMVKIPKSLHDSMKMMCVLTHKNMTEFVRAAIQNQINELKKTIKRDL